MTEAKPVKITGWAPAIFDRCADILPGREGDPPVPVYECRFCKSRFAGSWEQNPASFAHECSVPEPLTVVVTKIAP